MEGLLSQIAEERYSEVFEMLMKLWILEMRKNYICCLCEWENPNITGSELDLLYSEATVSLLMTINDTVQLVNSLESKSDPIVRVCTNMLAREVLKMYNLKKWIDTDYISRKNREASSIDGQVVKAMVITNEPVQETSIIAIPIGGSIVDAVPYEPVLQEEPRADPTIVVYARQIMSFTRRLFGCYP